MARYNDVAVSAVIPKLGEYALFKGIGSSDLEAMLNCVGARIEKYDKNTCHSLKNFVPWVRLKRTTYRLAYHSMLP